MKELIIHHAIGMRIAANHFTSYQLGSPTESQRQHLRRHISSYTHRFGWMLLYQDTRSVRPNLL
jgi:hypothetical protein